MLFPRIKSNDSLVSSGVGQSKSKKRPKLKRCTGWTPKYIKIIVDGKEIETMNPLIALKYDRKYLDKKEPRLDPEINPIYQGLNRSNNDVKKSLFANYREELSLNRVLKLYNDQCKGEVVGIRHGQRHLLRSYQKLQYRKEMIVRSRSAPGQLEEELDEDDEEPLTTVHLFGTDIKTRPTSGNPKFAIDNIARENKPDSRDYTYSRSDVKDTGGNFITRNAVTSPPPPYADGKRPEPPNSLYKPSIIYQETKRPKSVKKAAKFIPRPHSSVFITQRQSTPERWTPTISRPRSHQFRKAPSAYDVIAQQGEIDPHSLPSDIDRDRFINSSYYRKSKSPRLRDHVSNEVAFLFRQMKIKV